MKQGVFAILLALAACGGGGGGGAPPVNQFGLTQRIAVRGLTFPTGQPQPNPLTAIRVFAGLSFASPLFLTAAPGDSDRIFVVEQAGRIHVFPGDDAVTTTTVFLDISARVTSGGEQGLLGFAFSPEYASNGFFHVYYSVSSPRRSRISRFSVTSDPDVADPASEKILLEFDQPFANHNGGMLAFGPDGKLYIASGDGGSGNDPDNHAQSLSDLLGKILRIDPDGSIPADNPFVGQGGARGEIWAYGLRNPWRFSFDRNTGRLWLADVGQNAVEEIDIIERGQNYGWRVYEGDRSNINPGGQPPTAFRQPVFTYPHSEGSSVTGGYVYRGTRAPSLYGAYVYADFVSDRIWALVHDGSQVVSNTQVASVTNPASLGEDADGELYVVSLSGGVFGLEESGGGGPAPFPARLSQTGLFSNTGALAATPGLIEYDTSADLWSDNARKRRWMALPATSRITLAPTGAWQFPVGTVLVEHFELDLAPGAVRRVETRVLINENAGWQGYTYRWNDAQTDADLLAGKRTDTFLVEDPAAPGGQRQQEWTYPSRTDCLGCHTSSSGRVLGVRTRQLNRDFPYPTATDNQLRAWNHIGLFTTDIGEHIQYEAMPDPFDSAALLADRARAYLAVNCSPCHQAAAPGMDLRYGIPLAQTNIVGVPPADGDLGLPNAQRIRAGVKESSVLWERLRRLDSFRMPPLASSLVHQQAVDLIGQWIDGA